MLMTTILLSTPISVTANGVDKNSVKIVSETELNDICKKIGNEFCISPAIIKAICKKESNFNQNAKSSYGAIGLMQINPEIAKKHLTELGMTVDDLYDPYNNILCGTSILSKISKHHSNVDEALILYKSGNTSNTEYITDILNIAKEYETNDFE